ncbi:MAG: TIGR00299 family protein [Chloroflexi bacterium]|nr:TIGR00299 family protein [Chloroflexota bacterium]|tara:strand:+ start:13591 stop:14772 length:1182 start_codon:yes stop_codon:yes gene_type:complete
MQVGYFSLIGGVSGDMLLGALIDLGVETSLINSAIKKLDLDCSINSEIVQKGGVKATKAIVNLGNHENTKFTWNDFKSIINSSSLNKGIQKKCIEIISLISKAEKMAHKTFEEDTHLEELGSIDTLIDIVCTIVGIQSLNLEKIYSSPLPFPSGSIKTQHGQIPASSPATTNIALIQNATFKMSTNTHNIELVTPTGAALITSIAEFSEPTFQINKFGYGAGSRELENIPNIVQLLIGQQTPSSNKILHLETNIDDTNPQIIGYIQEKLFQHGALDVWVVPIQMKKGRPGIILNALIKSEEEQKISELILRETSTLGIRKRFIDRLEAKREIRNFHTRFGIVSAKIKWIENEIISISPEYEECKEIAENNNIPLIKVQKLIEEDAWNITNSSK